MSAEVATLKSMTGFCSVEAQDDRGHLRIDMKTVNHRFLDLKLRLPRELSALEGQSRSFLQTRLARGSVEVRVEFTPPNQETADAPETNFSLAAHYFETLTRMQKMLGLEGNLRTIDIALLPDVITRKSSDAASEDSQALWPLLERTLTQAVDKLQDMRAHEGANLGRVLNEALQEIQSAVERLRGQRERIQALEKQKIQERVTRAFESFPIANAQISQVLESRVAQELALILERGDVEEELTRLDGHVGHFRKTLTAVGGVGKKLEFLLQEMHREINTLGSKSQDLGISDEVVALKVRIEQIREQVMNLE